MLSYSCDCINIFHVLSTRLVKGLSEEINSWDEVLDKYASLTSTERGKKNRRYEKGIIIKDESEKRKFFVTGWNVYV